jgi:hypothetical protein
MSRDPEDYIAASYTIHQYNKTYEHHMLPTYGMSTWPRYDHPRPSALGYVIMLGQPRKERRRDPSEANKYMKLLKAATTTTKCTVTTGSFLLLSHALVGLSL